MRRPEHQRGVSLLEMLVALTILMVILLGLAMALSNSVKVDGLSRERAQALFRAQSMLEDVIATDYATLPTRNGETFDVQIEAETTTSLIPGGGRALPGLVQISNTTKPDLLRIEVSVIWRSGALDKDVELWLRSHVGKH